MISDNYCSNICNQTSSHCCSQIWQTSVSSSNATPAGWFVRKNKVPNGINLVGNSGFPTYFRGGHYSCSWQTIQEWRTRNKWIGANIILLPAYWRAVSSVFVYCTRHFSPVDRHVARYHDDGMDRRTKKFAGNKTLDIDVETRNSWNRIAVGKLLRYVHNGVSKCEDETEHWYLTRFILT